MTNSKSKKLSDIIRALPKTNRESHAERASESKTEAAYWGHMQYAMEDDAVDDLVQWARQAQKRIRQLKQRIKELEDESN